MSLPRRRSRLIRIDGEAYRWLASPHWEFEVDEEEDDWERSPAFIDVYVEHRREPLQQLQVRIPASLLLRWGRDPMRRNVIDPGLVRRAVQLALREGWQPRQSGETFAISPERVRFIETPRHLLYSAAVIAQVLVESVEPVEPGMSRVRGRVMELLRGDVSEIVEIRAAQPADLIPENVLVFAFREPSSGALVTWRQYGGVFMIAEGRVLLYDQSTREDRWAFLSLTRIRRELRKIQGPLDGGEE